MESWHWLILAFAPGAFWLWFVRHKDDLEPEPKRNLLLVFALGVGSAFLVLWTRFWFEAILPDRPGLGRELLDAFVVTAANEELMKFVAFFAGAFWLRELDEPLDGLVYGVAAGLGFASIENWFYLRSFGFDLGLLGMRAVTSTLAHLTCSGALGFFVGMVWFQKRAHPLLLVAAGVTLSVGMHGLFDFFLFRGQVVPSLLIVLPAMLIAFGLKLRWARARSPEYHG